MSFLKELNDSVYKMNFINNPDIFFSFLKSESSDVCAEFHASYLNKGENQYSIAYKLKLEHERVCKFTNGYLCGDKYDNLLMDYFNIDMNYYKKEAVVSFEKAKSTYDYFVDLFLSEGTDISLIPEFCLSVSDFEFFKLTKPKQKNDYSDVSCLSKNSHFIFKHHERLNDEYASYYGVGNHSYSENESYFWLHLRNFLNIDFNDIEFLSKGRFTRAEICKLEYPYKSKSDIVNIDRESYFNFLKGMLIEKNKDVFSDMYIEVYDYKFYISDFYTSYCKDSLYNNSFVFLPYNINKERKCMKTRLNFIVR